MLVGDGAVEVPVPAALVDDGALAGEVAMVLVAAAPTEAAAVWAGLVVELVSVTPAVLEADGCGVDVATGGQGEVLFILR